MEPVKAPGWHGRYYLVELDRSWHSFVHLVVAPRYAGDTVEMCQDAQCWVGVGGVLEQERLDLTKRFDTRKIAYIPIGNIQQDVSSDIPTH